MANQHCQGPLRRLAETRVRSSLTIRKALVTGLLLANTLVFVLAANSLFLSRQHYVQRAEMLTQNVANALEQNLAGTIARIDLSLRAVVDELQRQLVLKNIDVESMDAFLLLHERRTPEVDGFRVTGAEGLLKLGKGLNKEAPISFLDREYFVFLRDHPEAGLQVSKALFGRVTKQYFIGFVRRYTYPDGAFAGVVVAAVPVDYFASALARFDMGPNGALILRDAENGLIARVPPLVGLPAGEIGNKTVSREFQQLLETGATTDTYFTAGTADGVARTLTFNRLEASQMLVVAAMAETDYLSGWSSERYRTVSMGLGFLVLSLFLGAFLFRLIGQAERSERKVRESKSFVESVVDSLTEQIAVIDANGRVITANKAWMQFAADEGRMVSPADLVSAKYLELWAKVFTPTEAATTLAVASGLKAILDGAQNELSLVYECRSAAPRWFLLRVVPLQGSSRGAVAVHQNVTERKLAEQARERLREDELRFKDEFLSHVSHELRSPLTAIKQFTSILLGGLAGDLNEEQEQYERIVLKNVHQLQAMIDDLLEVTRLETGKATIELSSVSAGFVAVDAVQTLTLTAAAKDVTVISELPMDLPPVYADATRLLQVLIILLDNAVKFTPAGGSVRIRGRLAEEPGLLLLEVSDTGSGIAPELRDKLFARLFQATEQSKSSRKGLGLGLFICKELVTRQGGTIWVDSKPGIGSTFSITLPLFSTSRLIAPLVRNGRWPASSAALLTVHLCLPGTAHSAASNGGPPHEARNFLQKCLLPDLDILLPTRRSIPQGEFFYIAVFADEKGRSTLARRIQTQFQDSRVLNSGGRTLTLSYFPLPAFALEVGSSPEQATAEMAGHLESAVRSQSSLKGLYHEQHETTGS